MQSDAKEGEDLHGQAAIRLNVASRVDHVDHLDLHGQAAICLDVEATLAMWNCGSQRFTCKLAMCRSTWANCNVFKCCKL